MILTLWRHGDAESGVTDRLRQISDSGSIDVSAGCRQLRSICSAKRLLQPQRILYSPWVRTAQTAEIIAANFSQCSLAAADALRPDSNVASVEAVIRSNDSAEHSVLVLHQPLISALVDYYLGEFRSAPFIAPGGLFTMSLGELGPGCGEKLFFACPPTYQESV